MISTRKMEEKEAFPDYNFRDTSLLFDNDTESEEDNDSDSCTSPVDVRKSEVLFQKRLVEGLKKKYGIEAPVPKQCASPVEVRKSEVRIQKRLGEDLKKKYGMKATEPKHCDSNRTASGSDGQENMDILPSGNDRPNGSPQADNADDGGKSGRNPPTRKSVRRFRSDSNVISDMASYRRRSAVLDNPPFPVGTGTAAASKDRPSPPRKTRSSNNVRVPRSARSRSPHPSASASTSERPSQKRDSPNSRIPRSERSQTPLRKNKSDEVPANRGARPGLRRTRSCSISRNINGPTGNSTLRNHLVRTSSSRRGLTAGSGSVASSGNSSSTKLRRQASLRRACASAESISKSAYSRKTEATETNRQNYNPRTAGRKPAAETGKKMSPNRNGRSQSPHRQAIRRCSSSVQRSQLEGILKCQDESSNHQRVQSVLMAFDSTKDPAPTRPRTKSVSPGRARRPSSTYRTNFAVPTRTRSTSGGTARPRKSSGDLGDALKSLRSELQGGISRGDSDDRSLLSGTSSYVARTSVLRGKKKIQGPEALLIKKDSSQRDDLDDSSSAFFGMPRARHAK